MAYAAFVGASALIRFFILLLVLISVILIFTAPGVCFTRYINDVQASDEICPNEYLFPMSVDRWRNGAHLQHRGQNIWGQLAIVIIAILFAIPPLGCSCIQVVSGRSITIPQIFLSGMSFCIYIILGAVETWYATGFNHMSPLIRHIANGQFSGCLGIPTCTIVFVVKGWAVAAAFLFLCAVLFIVDIVLQFFKRDKFSKNFSTPSTSRLQKRFITPPYKNTETYRTRIHIGA